MTKRLELAHAYSAELVKSKILNYPAKDADEFEKHVQAYREDLQTLVDEFNQDPIVKLFKEYGVKLNP